MPRSWEQEYHHKKHRANVRKAKGTMAPRGGARRAVPKGRGSSFHEQGDALQASLDATAAAIAQLAAKATPLPFGPAQTSSPRRRSRS